MQIPLPLTLGRLPAPFDDPGWLYEIKYDGFRALAILEQGSAGAQKDFAIVANDSNYAHTFSLASSTAFLTASAKIRKIHSR